MKKTYKTEYKWYEQEKGNSGEGGLSGKRGKSVGEEGGGGV